MCPQSLSSWEQILPQYLDRDRVKLWNCFAKYAVTDSLVWTCELPSGKETLQKLVRLWSIYKRLCRGKEQEPLFRSLIYFFWRYHISGLTNKDGLPEGQCESVSVTCTISSKHTYISKMSVKERFIYCVQILHAFWIINVLKTTIF